ncbi:MAG: YicC family protein [Verrucomicrobia bacterium]|nr:YicC family protein [Verrucomicrobiota bacterium]MCF7707655.1 YicC family protein [Verrucomicrobiota bacterium]
MTGYGRGECAEDGYKVTVELSSVNRRQSEVSVSLPKELEALEPWVRDQVNRHVARGRVNARISLQISDKAQPSGCRFNKRLARQYSEELRRLADDTGVSGGVPIGVLLNLPGVMVFEDTGIDPDKIHPLVERALTPALERMIKMRSNEGAHLARELKKRVSEIRKSVQRVKKRAPQVMKDYQVRIVEKLKQAGLNPVPEEDDRLLKELVIYADRSDVSEEVSRLLSHISQFNDCVKSDGPMGRTLDFLAQEMNREINTIGSKANDAEISREVVILKTELEKFREQAQNVE